MGLNYTRIHNIAVSVGEGYDDAFDEFLKDHAVGLEPSLNVENDTRSGKDFGEFLNEFGDPAWVKAVADVLRPVAMA